MTIDLAYPLGRFQRPAEFTAGERAQRIGQIRDLPVELRGVDNVTDARYRLAIGGLNAIRSLRFM